MASKRKSMLDRLLDAISEADTPHDGSVGLPWGKQYKVRIPERPSSSAEVGLGKMGVMKPMKGSK